MTETDKTHRIPYLSRHIALEIVTAPFRKRNHSREGMYSLATAAAKSLQKGDRSGSLLQLPLLQSLPLLHGVPPFNCSP